MTQTPDNSQDALLNLLNSAQPKQGFAGRKRWF